MLSRIPSRGLIAFAHDIVMAAASFALALYLRIGDDIFYHLPERWLQAGLSFTVIAAAVFWFMGLYRGVWRYASMNDLLAITRAVSVVVLIFVALMFLWTRLEFLPRSLPVINWFVLMIMLGAPGSGKGTQASRLSKELDIAHESSGDAFRK